MNFSSKTLAGLFCTTMLFAACQKDVAVKDKMVNAETVSSDATASLACHTLSLVSDYTAKPGEVPPFKFTKTLYSDSRVKTINMLSRMYPNYADYKKQAVELIGTFSYSPNRAYLKGTSQVWEYYKTSTGAGARRSISKKPVDLKFFINAQGYCDTIIDLTQPREQPWLEPDVLVINKNGLNQDQIKSTYRFVANGGMSIYEDYKYPNYDQFGNIVSFKRDGPFETASYFTATYDYNIPRGSKNYSFIPSQNLISQEYSLLEVMQWRPQPTHQRKSVAGVFWYHTTTWITQSQTYKNYRFDSKGNQVSVTYGDNVLQKTSWSCK